MSTQTKSLRTEMLSLAAAQGWTPDPSALTTRSHYAQEWIQDPHVLLRPAAHGGQWRIKFDYDVKETWHRSVGDRLQSIHVWYIPEGAETESRTYEGGEDRRGNKEHPDVTVEAVVQFSNPLQFPTETYAYDAILKTPTTGYYSRRGNYLYDATGLKEDGDTWYTKSGSRGRTLRERATIFVTNPDLALWVAAEIKYQEAVRTDESNAKAAADAAARAQVPAGVAVEADEWKDLLAQLNRAAGAVYNSDGKTVGIADKVINLGDLVRKLEQALAIGE